MRKLIAILIALAGFVAACDYHPEFGAVYAKMGDEPGARTMVEMIQRGYIVNCLNYFTPPGGEGKIFASPDFGGWCLHMQGSPGYEVRNYMNDLYWQDGVSLSNRLVQSIKTKSLSGVNYGQAWTFTDNINFEGDWLSGHNCNSQVSTQVLAPGTPSPSGGTFNGVASMYWANQSSGGSLCY